jgi:isocitrate dehydrogenase (NAD+)
MVEEGRAQYADPSSILRATVMLLKHIGFSDKARKLEMALDICGQQEKKLIITGRSDGATGEEFADYVMKTIKNPELESKWQGYQKLK